MSDTTTPAPGNVITNLNVATLINIVRCVDYAAEQGAYKGWDTIMGVKRTRDEVQAFLDSLPKDQTTPESAPSAE